MKKKSEVIIHRPVVWVTGASGGIGREIAKQFASIGCEVCLSSRNMRMLDSVVKDIQLLGGRAYSFPIDITKTNHVTSTVKQILKKFGQIDVFVNNAGTTSFQSFVDAHQREINQIINTNLLGNIFCIKAVLPSMIKKRNGWIFNIISMVARKTYEGSSIYTASKAGMLGLGKVLREELKTENIKVVNIVPGAVDTNIWHPTVRKKYSHDMMKAKSVAEVVLSIYQMPDDVVVDEIVIRPVSGDLG